MKITSNRMFKSKRLNQNLTTKMNICILFKKKTTYEILINLILSILSFFFLLITQWVVIKRIADCLF